MSDTSDRKQKEAPAYPDGVLGRVVREARSDVGPATKWSRVDDGLFARIASERSQEVALAEFRGPQAWALMAGLVAAAAAAVIAVGHRGAPPDGASLQARAETPESRAAARGDATSTLSAKQ